jgi:hypothetical protein
MTRDELERKIGHHVAFAMTGNRMPDMSGDARNRLSPMQRRNCDHAVEAIIDHPRIARALAVIDRIGDEAAEAIREGRAAVVPVEATDAMYGAGGPEMGDYGHMDPDDDVYGDQAKVWSAMLAAGRLDRGGA